MTTFILIHGMWHGGWCWDRLSALLRDAGHDVHAPRLAGLGERACRDSLGRVRLQDPDGMQVTLFQAGSVTA